MGRMHRRKRHKLLSSSERKLLFAAFIVCIFLSMVLAFATEKFPGLKEKATESILMQYVPKDMERGEFLKKAKEATKGMDKEEVLKKAKEYLEKQKK